MCSRGLYFLIDLLRGHFWLCRTALVAVALPVTGALQILMADCCIKNSFDSHESNSDKAAEMNAAATEAATR